MATYSGAKHTVHKHTKKLQTQNTTNKKSCMLPQARPSNDQLAPLPHVVNTCDLLWSIISIQSRKFISKKASNPKNFKFKLPLQQTSIQSKDSK